MYYTPNFHLISPKKHKRPILYRSTNTQTKMACPRLTQADFLVVLVLLCVARQAALEAVLPELGEPGVPGVGVQTQLQEVVVERRDLRRLQLHGDAPLRLLLIALHHLVTVGPAIAAERERGRGRGRGVTSK